MKDVLEKAQALLDAIVKNETVLWEGGLDSTHSCVIWEDCTIINNEEGDSYYCDGIVNEVMALREAISKVNELEDGENSETTLVEDEPHCDCQCCGKRITIGESFQYETSGYTTYCDNTECTEGVATVGSLLEPCWFGEEE